MLVKHENGRLHVGVLFKEASDQCTDACGTGTVCFEHMTERLKEVADLLREKELQNEESLKLMSHLHSLLSLVRHRYLERGVDSLERDIDTLLGQSEKALGPFWKKQMQQTDEPKCSCGKDRNPPNIPRLAIVCPKHDRR